MSISLKINHSYKNVEGHLVHITDCFPFHRWEAPFSGEDQTDGMTCGYSEDGRYDPVDEQHPRNLIEEVGKITDTSTQIEKGQRWRYNGLNAHLQASLPLNPAMWMYLTVTKVSDAVVWYYLDSLPNELREASIERLLSVAELLPDSDKSVQRQYTVAESYLIEFKL